MFNIDEIYTVSDFLSLCNKSIEENIPRCWLKGEISNLSRPSSGHWYFSLKDDNAQIRCALFRLSQRNIKFNPDNGLEVLVHANPTLYEARGDFQIIIKHIEPVGVGNLQLAFDQLKNKLSKEGLFDPIHKKPIPKTVNTIGVVSSSNGAVIKDIIKVLGKRYPFAEVLLFDCVVQGDGSAKKLARAINIADKSDFCDILIIARGGGSIEDLWAFNEEIIARAIFNAETPIISAIGHETDFTIADFVSDVRAPTPSAAAVLATPDRLEMINVCKHLLIRIQSSVNHVIHTNRIKLDDLLQRIPTPIKQVNFLAQRLDGLYSHLNYQLKTILKLNDAKLANTFEKLKQHSPSKIIRFKKELNLISKSQITQQIKQLTLLNQSNLNNLEDRMLKSIYSIVESSNNYLIVNSKGLNHLSPLKTLARGYSITSNENNELLKSTKNIMINDNITTKLSDGVIHSKIHKIENN